MKKFAKWILLFLVAGFIPLMVLGYSAYAMIKWRQAITLQEVGISVQCTILKSEESGLIRARSYEVTVRYPDPKGSDSLAADISVDESLYNILPKGAKYRLLVDPGNSRNVDLPGNQDYVEDLTYSVIGLILLSIGVIALIGMYRRGMFNRP